MKIHSQILGQVVSLLGFTIKRFTPRSATAMMDSDHGDCDCDWNPDEPISLDFWKQTWDGPEDFHVTEVEKNMKKHLDKMVAGRDKIKMFFPCCGKVVDMKWVYDHGHSVTGVEIAKKPLIEFFEEQKIEYTISHIGSIDGTVYQSKDGRIKLYECDLYEFNSNIDGKFDAIYDRKSFVSMNKCDREKYAKTMLELMAKGCRYMLITDEFDVSVFNGPPHSIPEWLIHDLYEEKCHIQQIEYYDQLTPDSWWSSTKLKHMYEKVHIITPK